MHAHLACMLLLCFTSGAFCTDAEQEQRSLADELLSSLLASKMKHSKQSTPFWRVSLDNLCRLLQQELWSGEEGEQEVSELMEGGLQLMEELYSLQHVCRALQRREERLLQDSLDFSEESSDVPLKRKSPYILKRQVAHSTKSRRPYILKRSLLY